MKRLNLCVVGALAFAGLMTARAQEPDCRGVLLDASGHPITGALVWDYISDGPPEHPDVYYPVKLAQTTGNDGVFLFYSAGGRPGDKPSRVAVRLPDSSLIRVGKVNCRWEPPLAALQLDPLPSLPIGTQSMKDRADATIDGITHTATTSSAVSIRGRTLLLDHGAGVALFDMDTGKLLQEFSGTSGFEASSLSPDGRRVATYSSNANPDYDVAQLREEIRIWDSASGKLLLRVPSHAGGRIGWTPDSRDFYTSLKADKTQLWETVSGRELPPILGIPRFSPDGSVVAVSQLGTTSLLNYPSRTELCILHAWMDRSLVFSPDGRSFAAVVRDTLKPPPFDRSVGWEVRVWDASTCRELHSFPVGTSTFSSVTFTPDGRSLVVNLVKPASAALLDAQTGVVIHAFIPALADFVTDALLSPDGQHLLTRQSFMDRQTFRGEQHSCSLWDVSSGKELHRWQEENSGTVNTCAGFSGDGEVVPIIAGDGIRSLWSAQTGAMIWQLH